MSTLTQEDIRKALQEGPLEDRLIITPLLEPAKQIGAGSVDLRLGTEFIETNRHTEGTADPLQNRTTRVETLGEVTRVVPLGRGVVLHPGQLLLGSSLEFVRIPNWMSGQVLTRSSWGRLGLMASTAPFMQPGYTGMITFELINNGPVPVTLYPGVRFAQLVLWSTSTPASKPYDARSKYADALGPRLSRLPAEAEELRKLRDVGDSLGVTVDRTSDTSIAFDDSGFQDGGQRL